MFIKVNEIFRSIQGEGFFTGTPCIFIRFQGCNIACEFCDTHEAQRAGDGNLRSIWSIVEDVLILRKGTKIDRVVITGGEPFLQSNTLYELCVELQTHKFNISIESNGTVEIDNSITKVLQLDLDDSALSKPVYLTISPKHVEPMDEYIGRADEIKLLVGGSEDNEPPIPDLVKKILDGEMEGKNSKYICFQPISTESSRQPALQRAMDLCFKYGEPLSIQLHKYLNIQ